jgi:hypothetical protein
MSNGFYIKEIRIVGSNVAPASIIFERGFNSITGPSNTGKSYIFSCINYMLGGTDLPEPIGEADGYTDVYMQICDYNDKAVTLKRSLKGGDFIKSDGSIEESFTRGDQTKLKTKHSKNSSDNISRFLLSMIDVDLKYVKKNANNKKNTLSFRDIANLILVSEERILTKKSPIIGVSHPNPTLSNSVFKFILTGKDAEELVEVEEPEIKKGKLNAKIETVEEFIESLTKSFEDLKIDHNLDIRLGEINIAIDELFKTVAMTSQQQENATIDRQNKWENIQKLESRILMLNELKDRFNLLLSQYFSDIKRLDFIQEGEDLINQLSRKNCPVCGHDVEDDHIECLGETINLKEAINSEMVKISLRIDDLKSTISQMEEESIILDTELSSIKSELQAIERFIDRELSPIRANTKNEIDKLLNEKNSLNQGVLLESKILELAAEKSNLLSKRDTKENAIDNTSYSFESLTKLCDEIATLLASWEYGKSILVLYDETKSDIIISNKARAINGKGYRSISFSAFIIGLLKYSVSLQKNHPRLVVLDSPLTAYKKKDTVVSNKDKISENIEVAFFEDLAKTPKDQQIIIFDNKEPSDKISKIIKHIQFTRDKNIGRYGFFPV